jgi:NAD-dependent deacetylase
MREADSVVVLTGAGMSAESGVPTFRGRSGLWNNFRPEELATPQAFSARPHLVWEWYAWRREKIAKAEPHAGHVALAELEQCAEEFHLITQNVDGLHERAGNKNVVRLHGNIWETACTHCGLRQENRDVPLSVIPPHCDCEEQALLRPGVVWFGEVLPAESWAAAERAVQGADLFLVVGTSAVVYPAAGLISMAQLYGAHTVEINPQETPMSEQMDVRLEGTAAELLPDIVAVCQERT